MAKTTSKTTSRKPFKKTVAEKTKKTSPAKKKSEVSIEDLSEQILDKLRALDVAPQLQSDIGWCLGSYRHDHNPVGLYATSEKALSVLTETKSKNSKAVSAKLIADIEKILAKD